MNGQVLKEYVGGGALGALAAKMDALKRLQQEEEVQALRKERLRMEALEAPLEELCTAAEILSRATLLPAGYRRHKRGEWRRKREAHKKCT